MEDTLLIDAAERFVRGEMSPEERTYFEDLRKNNPELDQAVVEQIFFLNQLDNYSGNKNFKSALNEVETKLIGEKFMTRSTTESRGKLVTLWNRYRKTVAVAASIAAVVSLFIAGLVSSVSTNKNGDINEKLIGKIDQQEKKTQHIESQLNMLAAKTNTPLKPAFESDFRGTGFMIDATGNYIVTNAHVAHQFPHRLVVENNKGDQYDASAVYINDATDIAIVKITDTSFRHLPTTPYSIRKNTAELGESIFMLGYPKQEIVYGEGYVSAKNGYLMDTVYCQITTAANEGNSGSPVLSKNGDIIGIATSKQINATGVVFAVKSANIYRAIEDAKKAGTDNIKIASAPALKGLDRVNQLKKIEDYVFMIKGN